MAVLYVEVLIEKSDRLAGGRSGEANNKRVEIEQHLAPQLVNGAVALIHNDEVEELGWDAGVIADIGRLALPRPGRIESRTFLVAGVKLRLALQH